MLLTRNPRGLFSYTISPEAPGPLQMYSERANSGHVEGYWLDLEAGYRGELALPASASNTDISFEIQNIGQTGDDGGRRVAGPLGDPDQPGWISLTPEWQELSAKAIT